MRREDGILEMVLHSNGDSLLWNDRIHEELVDALYMVGRDTENRVIILTGAGQDFCPGPDPDSFHFDGSVPPVGLDHVYSEGKELIQNLLNVRVPMIAAVNGKASAHSELALLCDIVLVDEAAAFSDPHFRWGIVPGDGIHIAYLTAFGMNRGRMLMLTGEEICANDARACGAVAEVLPTSELLDRSWEIARKLAAQPILALRYTREVMVRELQRMAQDHLGIGLALEGFASGYGSWAGSLHCAVDQKDPGK
jgi:enoyl-CoA hydratase/carnithine racemase